MTPDDRFRGARPVIGVTGPDRGGAAAWLFTRAAVFLAGGRAVRITPRRPRPIDRLHGLILGGGADVDPALYGADPTPVLPDRKPPNQSWLRFAVDLILLPLTWVLRKVAGKLAGPRGTRGDATRDALEMKLLDDAVTRELPVLGICRGEQLLNTYFGGSLHRDLAAFYVEDPATRTVLPRKRVVVESNSRLFPLLGADERVNALHKQGVDRVGEDLRVAARDRNGIVQAIEHTRLPFVVGVQWHPEYLPQIPSQRAIFSALVEQAKRVQRNWRSQADRARVKVSGMSTSDAQKSEVHDTTDDAATAPASRAGQASGDARKDVDRAPDDLTLPGKQPGNDRVSEGHRDGRGE